MLDIKDIEDAHERIKNHIKKTPLVKSHFLENKTDIEVFLKLENLQRTGSYKFRGALNKILTLSQAQLEKGVVAASAGNHAQGVALAAKILKTKATIVMPLTTPLSKVQGTQDLGAHVILHGNIYDEAYEKALHLQKQEDFEFIHPFNDPLIMAGQGTIGLELYNEIPDLDVVFIPIGGGGLISGIAFTLKTLNPKIKIIGVEATSMAAMKESIEKDHRVTIKKKRTMADGIAVAKVGNLTFDCVKKYVDQIISVSEAELSRAVMTILEKEKLLTEGAGAAAYASILANKLPEFRNKKSAIILSGGNIDINFLGNIISRGLAEDGRLKNLSLVVQDTPGTISNITKLIGELGANILDIHHDRTFTNAHLGETDLSLTIETKGPQHIEQIIKELCSKDIKVK